MKSRLLDESNGRCTYAVVFDIGDEVSRGLLDFAAENHLDGSAFTAIGAFEDVVLGYYDWNAKQIVRNRIDEQVEVLSLIGNIARSPDGSPQFHAHVAVSKRDGSAWGGHLIEAHVRPTLEVIVTESPGFLQRTYDEQTGMAVIALA
ncbi:MAG TPA: PPC domain-containing DNA-binding protein [Gemmatimonadaceae bacterium]